MKILAYVDKAIGGRCADFMVGKFPHDEYTFVMGKNFVPDAALKQHTLLTACDDTTANLRAMPEGHFDWLLNLWGSDILRREDLRIARRSLNIHPSLLPYARGRDPVVWTIRNGWPAGATLHSIEETVDCGPVWAQRAVPYRMPTTGGALYARVVDACGQLFADEWPNIRTTTKQPTPQESDLPIFRRKQLEPDQIVRLDDTIRRLLAHDFNDGYRAVVEIDGARYQASLSLKPLDHS